MYSIEDFVFYLVFFVCFYWEKGYCTHQKSLSQPWYIQSGKYWLFLFHTNVYFYTHYGIRTPKNIHLSKRVCEDPVLNVCCNVMLWYMLWLFKECCLCSYIGICLLTSPFTVKPRYNEPPYNEIFNITVLSALTEFTLIPYHVNWNR